MPEPKTSVTVDILDSKGNLLGWINLVSGKSKGVTAPIIVLSKNEVKEFQEEKIQLLENHIYEYEIVNSKKLRLQENEIVVRSTVHRENDSGRLETGSYSGVLFLIVENQEGCEVSRVPLEIRTLKLDYRKDYRLMVEDIADKCSDLLLDITSPTKVRFTRDVGKDIDTLQQRFAFIQSLLQSKEFRNALEQVIIYPHNLLKQEDCEVDARKSLKLTKSLLSQIASSHNRISLIPGSYLFDQMKTIGVEDPSFPRTLHHSKKTNTVDTPENRFVKFALVTFLEYLEKIIRSLKAKKSPSSKLIIKEAGSLRDNLTQVLQNSFFTNISEPHILPLGSPVLQRKSGYREILRMWLKFQMVSRLIWTGGEDVYGVGSKDMGLLYEYWVFFQLLEMIRTKFRLKTPSAKVLFEFRKDGFGLKLKSGNQLLLDGKTVYRDRVLCMQFGYNRTFEYAEGNFSSGSWTRRMRPDFTISFWPEAFTIEEANKQELMVHVHFDAKYRADNIETLFGSGEEDLDDEKRQQRKGTFKRADLLKMHAYRDAVRRTEGAYIIYPGDKSKIWSGYHEILPGIGAFSLKPNQMGEAVGLSGISNFLDLLLRHLSNRASKREELSYQRFKILGEKALYDGPVPISEKSKLSGTREKHASQQLVLVKDPVSNEEFGWIWANKKLIVKINSDTGSNLSTDLLGITFVLLNNPTNNQIGELWVVIRNDPRILQGNDLFSLGYPEMIKGDDIFIIFDIEPSPDFDNWKWNIERIRGTLISFPSRIISLDRLLNLIT